MSVHRSGLLERILDGMQRVPAVRRLAALLEPRRTLLIELDQQITEFYHRLPAGSSGDPAEYLSRCIFMFELVLIIAVWATHYLPPCLRDRRLEAVAGNVLFFVPFELGAREGAFYLLFGLFGLDPQLGLYASIVSRVATSSGSVQVCC